ncbi:phosducin-like protein 2 [Patagioenas fasciata]|uniref:phosducin-like protein 2 n=1 Tax=Patagioenas fasciata TaxID=372321 RepID=UPI003A996802
MSRPGLRASGLGLSAVSNDHQRPPATTVTAGVGGLTPSQRPLLSCRPRVRVPVRTALGPGGCHAGGHGGSPQLRAVLVGQQLRVMRELEQWGRLRGPCCAAWPGKERRKDPNEDTQWNDILRHFGILPPKEKPKDETAEIVLHSQKAAEVKPYERMNLEELKEAEDDFDEADRKAIEMYRQQCLQEWKCLQRMQKYRELREISGEQYVEEVTIAPEDVWVIIHLYRTSIPMCLLVNGHLSLLVRKFPGVKFLKAIVNSCIQNYNDRCLPTILLYKTGEIKGRFIGIAECGGIYLKVEELEWKLAEVGAIETDLKENPQKSIMNIMTLTVQNISAHEDTNTKNSDVMKPHIT